MEDIKEEIKCEIRLLLHTKILKVAKAEDLERTASNILALIEKKEAVADVLCSVGLDAPYELARLVEACRQLITAAGYDAGNVPKARAPWVVLCNVINYYGDKGI